MAEVRDHRLPRRTTGSADSYRADIDALRALAVVLVVLFHAQLPLFAGGFVGVDVFFVISGYLITAIVTSQIDRGTFSLRGFYESRLRRIVPALAVMVLVVFLACYVLGLYVDDFQALRRSVRAALLFFSNVYFRGSTGYFDTPAHSQVMLHTWSLGVEAQFYLAYPVLAAFVYRRWPGRFAAVLLAGAAASFALCEATVRSEPAAAFFLLPSRAWELLLGGALAATGWTAATQAGKRALVHGGLFAIVGAAVTYDRVIHPAFPGFAALLPVLGAAAYIAGGDGLVERRGVLRFMLHPVAVFIGLISYSLYLWHWPVFVIARRISVDQRFTPVVLTGLVLLIAGLAVASWRFIELPTRSRLATWPPVMQYAVLAAALVSAWAPSQWLRTQYFLTARQARLAAGASDRATHQRGALLGVAGQPPRFLVLGDSHADALSEVFARAAQDADIAGRLFYGSVLINAYRARAHGQRDEQEAELRRLVATENYEAVYIVKRWTLDIEGYLPAEHPTPALEEVGLVHDAGAGPLRGPLALEAALQDTVSFLRAHGVRTVYLVLPIPECSRNVPQAASFLSLFHDEAEIDRHLGVTETEYRRRHATSLRILEEIAVANDGVELLDPWPVFGRASGRSQVLEDGRCLYYDDDHLSVTGSLKLLPLLEQLPPFHPPAAVHRPSRDEHRRVADATPGRAGRWAPAAACSTPQPGGDGRRLRPARRR